MWRSCGGGEEDGGRLQTDSTMPAAARSMPSSTESCVRDYHLASRSDSASSKLNGPGLAKSLQKHQHSTSTRGRRDNGGGEGEGRGRGFGKTTWAFKDFRIIEELGVGARSTVFRVVHISSGVEVALKCYLRSQLNTLTLQQVRDEIAIHSSLSHPDITDLHGWFEDASGNYYLMLELAKNGDAFDLMNIWSDLHDSAGPSESQVCRTVLRPLISAVAHLHSLGIMHRDIKAENLLMTDDKLSVKLADFGFAINFRQHMPVTRLGTLEYMVGECVTEIKPVPRCASIRANEICTNACNLVITRRVIVSSSLCFSPNLFLRPYDSAPELLRCDIEAQRRARSEGKAGYGPAVDCWAIGVLAYECLVGKVPYEGTSMGEMLEMIDKRVISVHPTVLQSMSPEAQNFIMRCMDAEPITRLTAHEMLSHPWIVRHHLGIPQQPRSTLIFSPAAELEHTIPSPGETQQSGAGGARTGLGPPGSQQGSVPADTPMKIVNPSKSFSCGRAYNTISCTGFEN
jgi:serine/threonine protein kinase